VAKVMFEILEIENILKGDTRLTLVPEGKELLNQLLGAESVQ